MHSCLILGFVAMNAKINHDSMLLQILIAKKTENVALKHGQFQKLLYSTNNRYMIARTNLPL